MNFDISIDWLATLTFDEERLLKRQRDELVASDADAVVTVQVVAIGDGVAR